MAQTSDEMIAVGAQIELARRRLYDFCQALYPDAYKEEREYLEGMCDRIEHFVRFSKKRYLVISVPPRHLKSFTAQNLTKYLFGLNIFYKVMTASYNERLSTMFAKAVRNSIQAKKTSKKKIVYSDIFPKTKVRYGEASASSWALEGNEEINYLATSPGGTATGIGANIIVVDDPIKNAEEAYNDNVLEDIWEWFTNTLQQRTEGNNYKFINIMTRWANGDLAGRIIEAYGDDVEVIEYKAVQPDGSMLCDDILTHDDYLAKTQEMNEDIAQANYNQTPMDVKGRLYDGFTEWKKQPEGQVFNFVDTADKGEDFLCAISGIRFDKEFYITDIVLTDEPMEVTEPLVAGMLYNGNVNVSRIESNNGGRGFARNVRRILKEDYDTNRVVIEEVPQTSNKESRILASSAWVQNHVYMPQGWEKKYPQFYKQVMGYQKKGKNKHDDAVDVLASIYEFMTNRLEVQVMSKSDVGLGRRRRSR